MSWQHCMHAASHAGCCATSASRLTVFSTHLACCCLRLPSSSRHRNHCHSRQLLLQPSLPRCSSCCWYEVTLVQQQHQGQLVVSGDVAVQRMREVQDRVPASRPGTDNSCPGQSCWCLANASAIHVHAEGDARCEPPRSLRPSWSVG